jgi:predicted lipoprotein
VRALPRVLLRSATALVWVLLLQACDAAPTRAEVLRSLITRQLVPNTQSLARDAAKLTASLRALSAAGEAGAATDPARVIAAQRAWRSALLSWERVYTFRVGPLVAQSGLLRARFWPAREPALRARLADSAPVSATSVEQLGVDVRGMYALEWLLFANTNPNVRDGGADGARARALAVAFAENAQGYVDRALNELGDGSGLVDSLAERAQESVSQLVNQMIGTIETLASDRVATVLEMHAHQSVRTSEVQGGASGVSTALVTAQLNATEALYVGHDGDGLSALVRPVAPKIDEQLRARFARARTSVEQLRAPLEQAVVADRARVLSAFRALKELELALKVDLASALGVTLTFSAGDGD